MYSKEESIKIKKEFWVQFAEKYPQKWMLYDTKIKDFSFKFFVDNKKAQVFIDIEMRSEEKRMAYFDKLVSLKSILEEEFISDLVFEKNFTLETGKNVSRIWIEKTNVSLNNQSYWAAIFDFFAQKMTAFEKFYTEYDEFIKDIEV